jgi:hypothetical protein
MNCFLIGWHSAAIGSVQGRNGGEVTRVVLFFPSSRAARHVRFIDRRSGDCGDHGGDQQN